MRRAPTSLHQIADSHHRRDVYVLEQIHIVFAMIAIIHVKIMNDDDDDDDCQNDDGKMTMTMMTMIIAMIFVRRAFFTSFCVC